MNLTDLIPGFTWIKAAIFGGIALALLAGGFYGGYRWELGTYEAKVAADATAQVKSDRLAMQFDSDLGKQVGAISLNLAGDMEHTVYVTQTQIMEVPRYVTAQTDSQFHQPCGLVRLHDAGILGVDPSQLDPAACGSDGAVAPVATSALAANDLANYGVCHQYEDQNDALKKYINTLLASWAAYQAKVAKQ